MEHLKSCNFTQRLKVLASPFHVGDGEMSGTIWVEKDKITFSDGWNSYPDIDFIFCPICGVRLIIDTDAKLLNNYGTNPQE